MCYIVFYHWPFKRNHVIMNNINIQCRQVQIYCVIKKKIIRISLNRKLNKSKYIISPYNIENLQENYFILFCHEIINYWLFNFILVVPIFNLKSLADFKTLTEYKRYLFSNNLYKRERKYINAFSNVTPQQCNLLCF